MDLFRRGVKEKVTSMEDYLKDIDLQIEEDLQRRNQMIGNIELAGQAAQQALALMYRLPPDKLPRAALEKETTVSTRVGAITVSLQETEIEVRVNASTSSYEGPYNVGVKINNPNDGEGTWDSVSPFEDWNDLPKKAAELILEWAVEKADVVKQIRANLPHQ